MATLSIRHHAAIAATLGVLALAPAASAQLFGRTTPGPDGDTTYVRAANIKFENEEHDFGVVADTNQIVCNFEFTNVGNDMLIISEVTSECGCTVPELKVRDYLPGESGSIEVRFEPKDRPGKQRKAITIKSNDVNSINGERKIYIDVDVHQAVKLSTPSLSIGRLIYGKGGGGEVTLTSKRDIFEIVKTDVAGSNLKAEIVKKEEITEADGTKAQAITVKFTVDPAAPMGYLDRQIMFTTRLSKEDSAETIEHLVRFHVSAHIAGQLQATPERLTFGTPAAGEKFERQVTIYNLANNPFKITNLRVEAPENLKLTVTHDTVTVNGKDVPRVRVEGYAPEERGSFNGKIFVSTDLPNEKDLEITFFGSVRASNRGPIVIPSQKPAGETDGDSDGSATGTGPATKGKPQADDDGADH
ncbi:MAG: DUF1573 domain-containing protein [Phycisphaerales bacterium]|nr:DUF1573 domain-containing protein [Phycisphaerales bacterium]